MSDFGRHRSGKWFIPDPVALATKYPAVTMLLFVSSILRPADTNLSNSEILPAEKKEERECIHDEAMAGECYFRLRRSEPIAR